MSDTMSDTWSVTIGEACSEGAPLGLVLDKQASVPTIKRISGSAQAAADAGAKIAARQRLISVGEQDVSGLDYLAAVDIIRAHRERPLLLTLADPAAPSIAQLTAAEMEARSKAATAEGLKKLRTAMLTKADDEQSESDSELSSDDGSEERFGECAPQSRRRRRRSHKPSETAPRESSEAIRKLEIRERRMQLELVNAQAEREEAQEEKAKLLAEVVLPVRKVEEELCVLQKAVQRTFKTSSGSAELKEQLHAWRQECEAHAKVCRANLEQLSALPTVKACLSSALSTEMAALKTLERDWMRKVRWAERWECAKVFCVWCVVAGVAAHAATHMAAEGE